SVVWPSRAGGDARSPVALMQAAHCDRAAASRGAAVRLAGRVRPGTRPPTGTGAGGMAEETAPTGGPAVPARGTPRSRAGPYGIAVPDARAADGGTAR